jgi:hypothetical protein
MTWAIAATTAVSLAMSIGSNFAKDEGTKNGLRLGGMGVGLLGGGIGSAIGGGASAAAGGLGSAGGGLLSGGEMASAAPSLFGGLGGGAAGGAGGLLGGGQMASLAPLLFGGGAGAAPGLAGGAGAGSLSSMLGPVVPNTPSALAEAMQTAEQMHAASAPGMGGMAGMTNWIPSAPQVQAAGAPVGGPAAGIIGGTAQPGMTVPQIPQPSAINQALSNIATTQEQMAKMQALDRSNRPQAQAPHFFIPQGGKAPSIGAPIARGPSPLERYAMMLRR